jgi:2,3-diketo-5-methylthio-1-phosphopentane phosphatase
MNFWEPQKLAVLCDFDGTITPGDTLSILYNRFAGPECLELEKRWSQGEISAPAEMQGCFGSMRTTRAELESALDPVQIDPGFSEFFGFCQEQGYAFAVLSDGLRWYIVYILQRHGIPAPAIYANEIEFAPDGVHIHSPWYRPDTPLRGTSKPAIIQKYQAEGYAVVFIGDGPTDIEAVAVADYVFAKGRLAEYCRGNGIPFITINNFFDVLQHWKNKVMLY